MLATYSYDNLGRRTGIARGNGTATSYSFDPVSRLTSLSQDLAGTASDQTIGSITYNPDSQITAQTKSNDTYAWSGHYNVNRGYTVNGLNQQTAAGATTLGYDARGNLTTSGTTTFTYNKLNQLTGTTGVTLIYDPAGQLSQIAGPSGTTRFAYAASQLVQESDTSGTVLRRYVPGPGVDEPLLWYEGSGTASRRWLHADERGSVIAVSDGSGAMLSVNRYDEYGIPQSGNLGRFQYTGQAWIPDLGMYNYKARMYSPTLGRFMQTDPIGYGDGLNLYNYVGSDPVNASDPSGLGAYAAGEIVSCGNCDWRRPPPPLSGLTSSPLGTNQEDGPDLVVTGIRRASKNLRLGAPPRRQNPDEEPIDWDKVGRCLKISTLSHYGLVGATSVSGAAAIPIPKAIVPPYRVVGSKTTNLLSVIGHYVEINVPRMLNSTNLFRVAGRANPLFTGVLLATDIVVISYDTYQCYNDGGR